MFKTLIRSERPEHQQQPVLLLLPHQSGSVLSLRSTDSETQTGRGNSRRYYGKFAPGYSPPWNTTCIHLCPYCRRLDFSSVPISVTPPSTRNSSYCTTLVIPSSVLAKLQQGNIPTMEDSTGPNKLMPLSATQATSQTYPLVHNWDSHRLFNKVCVFIPIFKALPLKSQYEMPQWPHVWCSTCLRQGWCSYIQASQPSSLQIKGTNLITFYNKHFLCYTPLTEIYSGIQLTVARLLKISKLLKRIPNQNSQLHMLLPKGKDERRNSLQQMLIFVLNSLLEGAPNTVTSTVEKLM